MKIDCSYWMLLRSATCDNDPQWPAFTEISPLLTLFGVVHEELELSRMWYVHITAPYLRCFTDVRCIFTSDCK
jgi:hypothetical protein